MRHLPVLILITALSSMLMACGAEAPLQPTTSVLETRQTAVTLANHPTMPPLPTLSPAPPTATLPVLSMPNVLAAPADDPRALGDPNAPVTIYEFTDYECPYCQQFFQETRSQIIAVYVEQGLVRIVARDYPLYDVHPSALPAAMAGHCAAAQQHFWPMYEKLFATHGVEWGGASERDRTVLVEFAGELGMDIATFSACMDDPTTEQAVREEALAAEQVGVQSTPNFVINGQVIRGALPFSNFSRLIESLLPNT